MGRNQKIKGMAGSLKERGGLGRFGKRKKTGK